MLTIEQYPEQFNKWVDKVRNTEAGRLMESSQAGRLIKHLRRVKVLPHLLATRLAHKFMYLI